jgi:hypothetical protein
MKFKIKMKQVRRTAWAVVATIVLLSMVVWTIGPAL